MFRSLLVICCALPLLQDKSSSYAQSGVSVPVTIMLEAPSASETASPDLRVDPTELSLRLGGNPGRFRVMLSGQWNATVVFLNVTDAPPEGNLDGDLILSHEYVTYTATDPFIDRTVTVRASRNAKVGEYVIGLTSSAGGVRRPGPSLTVTVTRDCSPEFSSPTNLNFGAWSEPAEGVESLEIAVNPRTGSSLVVPQGSITPVSGGTVTVGEYGLVPKNCDRCQLAVSVDQKLEGDETGHLINFRIRWEQWNPDGTTVDLGGGFSRITLVNTLMGIMGDDKYIFRIGGSVSNINSDTPSDAYTGDISIVASCVP